MNGGLRMEPFNHFEDSSSSLLGGGGCGQFDFGWSCTHRWHLTLALVVTIFESLDVLNAAKTMVAGLRNSFNAVVQKSLELKHSPYLE